MSDLPNISLVTILHNWSEFFPLLTHNWETIDYPKDKLEWIIIDDSNDDNSKYFPIDENILYIKVDPNEYLEKIDFPKDDEKIVWNYHKKLNKLTNGFKRDYAVGLTSHEYIFHLDYDTIYQPNSIKRKLRFLKDNKLECIYCKDMLCYDIYGKTLYKTENKVKGFESTLFHTKDFWKKGGFKWEDIKDESTSFYYNKGLDRKMDNYYDTIKLLSIHNMNEYKVAKISIENLKINIPEIVNSIKVDVHPLNYDLNDLFTDQKINVLGINSEIIDTFNNETWEKYNITYDKKEKEKKLISKINDNYDLCFLNVKFPIWKLFDSMIFNCIVIENEKNIEQMFSILNQKDYFQFNNLFLHKNYLLNEKNIQN
jgi:hypothetical protein